MLKVLKSNPANLDPKLNFAKMDRQSISQNPHLKLVARYWVHNNIFYCEFNISFRFPHHNICDTCGGLTTRINAAVAMGNGMEARRLLCEHKHEHEHEYP